MNFKISKQAVSIFIISINMYATCAMAQKSIDFKQTSPEPLVSLNFNADPSARTWDNETIYIYCSTDIESGIRKDRYANHFAMTEYQVIVIKDLKRQPIIKKNILNLKQIKWASRQLWAPDVIYKDKKYYLFFPARDKTNMFRIGVAISTSPEGPFIPEDNYIQGTFSIDPNIFKDDDGKLYLLFGGIKNGQLFLNGKQKKNAYYQYLHEKNSPALYPKIARLNDNLLKLDEEPRDLKIFDENSKIILEHNLDKRFFEAAWMFKRKNIYYLTYSTGESRKIVYATSNNPYGPFIYQGVILYPVAGLTTHHSIIEFKKNWYLFYHDTLLSGKNYLRNVKYQQLNFLPNHKIKTIYPKKRI